MLIKLALVTAPGIFVILAAEILRINKKISNETTRKVLHITHALVVIVWKFIIGYAFIIGAEMLFLIVVLLARRYKIFEPLRNVSRRSWGEFFFAFGIIAVASTDVSSWVFTAAMLHLGLADALAALIGVRMRSGVYKVFGQRKTVAGSATFFAASTFILLGFLIFNPGVDNHINAVFVVVFIPLLATLTENTSPYGSDNFTVPLAVVLLLKVS